MDRPRKSGWPADTPLPTWKFPNAIKLTPHRGSGQWCKRVNGKLFYFGPLSDDLHDQLATLQDAQIDLPELIKRADAARPSRSAQTVEQVLEAYLDACEARVERNDLDPSTLAQYHRIAKEIAAAVGKELRWATLQPADFERLMAAWSGRTVGIRKTRVNVTKQIARWAEKRFKLPAPDYGPEFKAPPIARVDEAREANAESQFIPAADILRLLHTCRDTPSECAMRAFILLGINGAMGNKDAALLPVDALRRTPGWVDYRRAKTARRRWFPLWPETSHALARVIDPSRELVAYTSRGGPFYGRTNYVATVFRKINERAGTRWGFYALRSTFATVAAEIHDPENQAQKIVMGHTTRSVHLAYRKAFDDSRIERVVHHVRGYVFPKAAGDDASSPKKRYCFERERMVAIKSSDLPALEQSPGTHAAKTE